MTPYAAAIALCWISAGPARGSPRTQPVDNWHGLPTRTSGQLTRASPPTLAHATWAVLAVDAKVERRLQQRLQGSARELLSAPSHLVTSQHFCVIAAQAYLLSPLISCSFWRCSLTARSCSPLETPLPILIAHLTHRDGCQTPAVGTNTHWNTRARLDKATRSMCGLLLVAALKAGKTHAKQVVTAHGFTTIARERPGS